MDGLKGYQHRRLELADMLREVLHIARGYRDQRAEQQVRRLLSRLAEDRFVVAITGQFSRGKSTLMNALLCGAYLPTGSLPTTAVVTTVRYGSRARAFIRRRGSSLPVETLPGEIARFVSQASTERAELQVASVEVEVPAELLRLGFEFADTRGIGSAITANTATTARFLSEADAVIFVTGFDSPLTEAETGFLSDALRPGRPLFLVVNKADLVTPGEAVQVTKFVRDWVREHSPETRPLIYGLSALEAVWAAAEGDGEGMDHSGVPAFRSALAEFLTAHKTRAALRNIAAAAAVLVRGQQAVLQLGQLATDGDIDPERVSAEFDASIQDLLARERAVTGRIAGRIGQELPGRLIQRAPGWRADLTERLSGAVRDLEPGDAPGSADSLEQSLEAAGQDITRDWLNRRSGEVHELITGMVASDITTLRETAASPEAMGLRLAGLTAAAGPGRLGWSAEDIPPLAIASVPWSIRVTPPRRRSRRAGPDGQSIPPWLARTIGEAAGRFESLARDAFEAAAGRWAEQLGDQAERETAGAAGRFRRYLHTSPRGEDVTALGELVTRLAGFQAALDAGDTHQGRGTDIPQSGAGSADVSTRRIVGCRVCHEMEEVLAEHLRHDQFRLATRGTDQAAHAASGGFCPLHTWQYAMTASPLGISAGYASLASSVTDALESIAGSPGTRNELPRAVAGLAQAGNCPVCPALAGYESSAVAKLAARPEEARAATLCLRHLALVLAAGIQPGTGRAMLRRLARALRRAGEDMRSYALKREALQNALVTDEESRAYEDVLRLLAGHPALILAQSDQQ